MEGNHEHTAHAPPGDRRLGTLRLANYVEYWWPRGENWGICNCRIWTSARASEGLRLCGACPTTSDTIAHRDHVHLGQNLRGANRQTTAYTGWSWCEPRDGMCSLSQPRAAGGVCRVASHAAYPAVVG